LENNKLKQRFQSLSSEKIMSEKYLIPAKISVIKDPKK
jgi:hypothetical protein